MIPIKDDAPRYTTPYITYLLIALNAIVFLFELWLQPDARNTFVIHFGVVPASLPAAFHVGGAVTPTAALLPLITAMFVHATWLHLIFNMWALWIFGDNVEDYLGHFRYLGFYFVCGILAFLAHIAFNWNSDIPSVGASGAIAGVMGAYFLLYPGARVLTWLFIFVAWLPAWIVLGYWFIVQFLSGATTSVAYSSGSTGGIAVWAHVGGFIAGLTLIKLMPQRPQRLSYD